MIAVVLVAVMLVIPHAILFSRPLPFRLADFKPFAKYTFGRSQLFDQIMNVHAILQVFEAFTEQSSLSAPTERHEAAAKGFGYTASHD